MEENELVGADATPETDTGTGEAAESPVVYQDVSVTVDTSAVAAEVAVLEEKIDATTAEVKVLTEQLVTILPAINGCYYMLIILVVLNLRRVLYGIIRKTRGGEE